MENENGSGIAAARFFCGGDYEDSVFDCPANCAIEYCVVKCVDDYPDLTRDWFTPYQVAIARKRFDKGAFGRISSCSTGNTPVSCALPKWEMNGARAADFSAPFASFFRCRLPN